MRAAVLALALLSVPAVAVEQAADRFDLVCSGHYRERVNGKLRPFEARFRVDLAAMEWCRDRCETVRTVASSNSGTITLAKSDPADTHLYSYQEIDRVAGKFRSYLNGGGTFWQEEASCTPAPYSGMPTPKF